MHYAIYKPTGKYASPSTAVVHEFSTAVQRNRWVKQINSSEDGVNRAYPTTDKNSLVCTFLEERAKTEPQQQELSFA
jgi:hypothetical protein